MMEARSCRQVCLVRTLALVTVTKILSAALGVHLMSTLQAMAMCMG